MNTTLEPERDSDVGLSDCFGARTTVTRFGGDNRYQTATLIADHIMAARTGDVEIALATGANFPDAMVISAWAATNSAPLLLTAPDLVAGGLQDDLDDFLDQHLDRITTVHLIGGNEAVSADVEAAIEAKGLVVDRHAGATRWETAHVVASDPDLFPDPRGILLATGDNWPDAIVAGPLSRLVSGGAPVLLTQSPNDENIEEGQEDPGPALHPETAGFVQSHGLVRAGYAAGGIVPIGRRAVCELDRLLRTNASVGQDGARPCPT